MTRLLAALACASVVACCATPTDYPATSIDGNAYPEECRRDLSWVTTPIQYVSPESMRALSRKEGHRVWGATFARALIWIDDTMTGWMKAEVIHHERCHVVAGAWHP